MAVARPLEYIQGRKKSMSQQDSRKNSRVGRELKPVEAGAGVPDECKNFTPHDISPHLTRKR